MRKRFLATILIAPLAALALAGNAWAAGPVKISKMDGPYKLVLQLLPAEPFLSKSEIKAGKHGMDRIRGAAANPLHASTAPNHHLIVHVLNASTGKAVTNADVRISYNKVSSSGKPKNLPVVEMQANGKGVASTHYGNNVHLSSGRYLIWVRVDHGTVIKFVVHAS